MKGGKTGEGRKGSCRGGLNSLRGQGKDFSAFLFQCISEGPTFLHWQHHPRPQKRFITAISALDPLVEATTEEGSAASPNFGLTPLLKKSPW